MEKATQDTGKDQLRNLLNQHARELADEAVRSDGQVSGSKLEDLEKLVRLVEIRSLANSPPVRRRWPVIVLLITTLLVVSVLFFGRVSTTEIDLDLSLSEVNFRFPRQQVLANVMGLSSLGVSGLQEVQLPAAVNREARVVRASDGSGLAVRLSVDSGSKQSGTVTLAALALPSGVQIGLSLTDVARQYRLSVKGKALPLRADVNGLVGVVLPEISSEQLNFVSPRSIVLQSGPDQVDLDISLSTGSKNIFPQLLFADSLSLSRIDEYFDNDRTIVRRVSTIMSGTLYFESLGGQERRLLAGQQIQFAKSGGEIRTLELRGDRIAFAFHGRVSGMTTGEDDNRVSLMPTYLEWLSARHGLSLLWGTTLYIFGLVYGALRWWRAST